MKQQQLLLGVLSCTVTLLLCLSCGQDNPPATSAKDKTSELPSPNEVPMDFGSGPGAEAFIANCQSCHTARYALIQPDLSRKAWEKTVDKMIKVYGAKIDSSTAHTIVDYLVARQ
jgi:cytochrome c5